MNTWIIYIALAVIAAGAAGVQQYRLNEARACVAILQRDLDSARANAAAWQEIASRHRVAIDAQADLAEACLQREERAIHDAAEIAGILHASPAEEITPEQANKGVSRETRRAAADFLNRPL